MRPADFSKPISIAHTRVKNAADLRAEALRIVEQACQIDAEVNELEEAEFMERVDGRIVRIVCDCCYGRGCDSCAESGFFYRAAFMGRGRHNSTMVENCVEIRDSLLADTWRTNDGRLLSPGDFEDGHLVNTVKLIRRDRFHFGRPRIYDLLLAELKMRELDIHATYSSNADIVQHDIDAL